MVDGIREREAHLVLEYTHWDTERFMGLRWLGHRHKRTHTCLQTHTHTEYQILIQVPGGRGYIINNLVCVRVRMDLLVYSTCKYMHLAEQHSGCLIGFKCLSLCVFLPVCTWWYIYMCIYSMRPWICMCLRVCVCVSGWRWPLLQFWLQ